MKEYDEKLKVAFPDLRPLPAEYHVKKDPAGPTVAEGIKTNRKKTESKTQRQKRTLQRHLDRLKTGEGVNRIGTIGDGNMLVILFGRQGKQPSFYGIHQLQAGIPGRGWFPVHPDEPAIPKDYKDAALFPRVVKTGFGDEVSTQYDSDEE